MLTQKLIENPLLLKSLDGLAYANAYYGQGTGDIALENVACSGTENQILACPSNTIFDTSCSHSEDAGVKCEGMQSDCYMLRSFVLIIWLQMISHHTQ